MSSYIKPDDQIQYGPEELAEIPDTLFNEYKEFLSSNVETLEEWKDVTSPSFWENYGLRWTGVDWIIGEDSRNTLSVRGDWAKTGKLYGIRVTFTCEHNIELYVICDYDSIYEGYIKSGQHIPVYYETYMVGKPITSISVSESVDEPPVYTLHITKIEIRQIPY